VGRHGNERSQVVAEITGIVVITDDSVDGKRRAVIVENTARTAVMIDTRDAAHRVQGVHVHGHHRCSFGGGGPVLLLVLLRGGVVIVGSSCVGGRR
jgi:hypothetical protein